MTALALLLAILATALTISIGKQMNDEAMCWEYKKLTMWRLN